MKQLIEMLLIIIGIYRILMQEHKLRDHTYAHLFVLNYDVIIDSNFHS
jgi:hypothetical protein